MAESNNLLNMTTCPCLKYPYIDAHCHLGDQSFDNDFEAVIDRTICANVKACIVVSENLEEFDKILGKCSSYPDLLYPCLGVHPVQGKGSVTHQHINEAVKFLHKNEHRIVGIGEVGLDFTPWVCPTEQDRQCQKDVFSCQIDLALQYDLPLNVHSRSAARETVQLLKEKGARRVLLHNFAGRLSVAAEAVSLGFYLSFPPFVIHKPERLKLLERIPLESICLETDSPALGPKPGERNEPGNIDHLCKYIAKVKGVDDQVVKMYAYHNTLNLFTRIQNKQTCTQEDTSI